MAKDVNVHNEIKEAMNMGNMMEYGENLIQKHEKKNVKRYKKSRNLLTLKISRNRKERYSSLM